MGQGQAVTSNPLLRDWIKDFSEPNTFVNVETKQKAECYVVVLTKTEESFIKKRMQEQHNFLPKFLYYEPTERARVGLDECKYFVYLQKTFQISQQLWVPVTSVLSILKGFRRLSSNYGLIKINLNMIKINQKKQIRVWVNENPLNSEPTGKVDTEERMLADIVKIVMEFDAPTGALMAKCMTINDAINNILHSLTQSKSQTNYSNRTNKNQDKKKVISKQVTEAPQSKINFRSTKETEDDSLKIMQENRAKGNKKQMTGSVQVQNSKGMFNNVINPKQPVFINVDRYQSQHRGNLKGLKHEGKVNVSQEYNSVQNATQKQSSIQFNTSQPTKTVTSGRQHKPVEYKTQNYISSTPYNPSIVSSQMSKGYQRPYRESEKTLEKQQELVGMPLSQFTYFPERKSNLSRNFLDKMELSQQSEVSNQKIKGSLVNDRSQINTSRQLIEVHSFIRPKLDFDLSSNRMKTQEFYTNNQRIGNSPRVRTNNHHESQHSSFVNKQLLVPPTLSNYKAPLNNISAGGYTAPYLYEKTQSQIYTPQRLETQQMPRKDESVEDEKRQNKLNRQRKINEELNQILGNSRPLVNDRSASALLIKQKIQRKREQLKVVKSQMAKLL